MAKIFSGGNHPPSSDLDGLPDGIPPDCFLQNDRKGCKRDNLDARNHFVLRFGAIGDKPLGVWLLRKTRVESSVQAEIVL